MLRRVLFSSLLASAALAQSPTTNKSADPCAPWLAAALLDAGHAPFAHAYPADAWTGPLATRAQRFVAKYSERAALVPDVRFTNGAKPKLIASRPVLIVSLDGLDAAALAELTRDYTRAFAKGLLGHPVPEGGLHLYVRFGTKSLDYNPVYRVQDFAPRPNGKDALEPLVALSESEEMRARYYAQTTSRDPAATLGDPSYAGATSGRTRGTMHDNRPLDPTEKHNCTSWICTAPIGDNNEAYLELAGAKREAELHTNPGWWLNHLLSSAPRDRVPLVVYWTQKKLPDALQRATSGKVLDWNFNYR